jgi:hypothetical protein
MVTFEAAARSNATNSVELSTASKKKAVIEAVGRDVKRDGMVPGGDGVI